MGVELVIMGSAEGFREEINVPVYINKGQRFGLGDFGSPYPNYFALVKSKFAFLFELP